MTIRIALAACAALALAGCSSGDKPAGEASGSAAASAPASSAAPAAPAAAAAPATATAGAKPPKDFVVGKWGNDGDCSLAVELKADGTSDGPFGNWSYADGVITFADAPEMKVTVVVSKDGKNMDSVNAQGGKHQMTRCS